MKSEVKGTTTSKTLGNTAVTECRELLICNGANGKDELIKNNEHPEDALGFS